MMKLGVNTTLYELRLCNSFFCRRDVFWRYLSTTNSEENTQTQSLFGKTSFFSHTSGRSARRRRRRMDFRSRTLSNGEDRLLAAQNATVDTRTVRDILWPDPFKDDIDSKEEDSLPWKQKFAIWREIFPLAVREYRKSWEGFTTSKGLLVEDEIDPEESKKQRQIMIQTKQDEVKDNIKKNARFIKDESEKLRKEFSDRTDIHTMDDVKRVTREMLRLASDCVNQFMAGYRKGRDDEIEKMMTQYFQEIEGKKATSQEETKKKKKRRPKRRVINPY